MKLQVKNVVLATYVLGAAFVPIASAAPSVESVLYDTAANVVTITGQGFGAGPDVVLFDDFESENLQQGDEIPLDSPVVGQWDEANQYYAPLLDSRAHSGALSFLSYDQEKKVMRQLKKNFDGGAQNVFLSQWVSVPEGTYFPGMHTTDYQQFPSDSSWKFSWLIDQDTGTESSNICAPTHVGGGRFYIAGNDLNVMTISGNDWWSWAGWNRLTTALIANLDDPTYPGFAEFGALSKENGLFRQSERVSVFDADGGPEKKYERINFPGWIRNSGDNRVETLYDDIYVAVGQNAVKRIELTNNNEYDSISMASIQLVDEWSDTQIVFTPRKGGLENIIESKIHYISADGNANFISTFPMPGKAPAKPPTFIN